MLRSLACGLLLSAIVASTPAFASGPRGFSTVIIDAGHGGVDRGGGPGQRIPEKPYTLDTSLRLAQALRARGFRVVMTRTSDIFVPLRDRVGIANGYGDAIFISVHYNSAPRVDAHGFETYYYRSDSFGLASRLHQAQLRSAVTEDRFVRRRGFYVVRNTRIPSVLCEGGFLTNPGESQRILSTAFRQRWAETIADALVAQRREGDPGSLNSPPPITTEHLVSSRGRRGGRRSGGGSRHRGGRSSSSRHHASSSSHRGGSSSRHTPSRERHRRHSRG